ncbi:MULTISPECIES: pyridoxamine 5'-phosphate oxidase family protein [unclassified Rhodococcus (in: high G+C Gram-positive bacteria)]|uniref:pyridoxamine 5'-phosphate oxidase family protein n=1 Tax=unclassified Rhodococcus (in: high G+C Gram-positive bacteria) TaxID=192944 RepID=UPI000A02C9ED|nr:pyridoxamine 5'-phosphate oxidase family protein [Rhodococcus sp. DK17]
MSEDVPAVTASVAAPLRGQKRWAYLARQPMIRLATSNEDGTIYLSSLWYVVDDEKIYLPIDAAGRHAANVRAGRALSALVDSGDEYATVAGVRILGSAVPIENDPERVAHLEQLVYDKYFYTGHPFAEPYFLFGKVAGRTYFELRPEKMIGWDTRETTTPQVTEVHELPDFLKDRRISTTD